MIAREQLIRYHFRKYLKPYGNEIIQRLLPTGSTPGKLYGLIKVHKEDNPARPVTSMVGSPEYKLAKFMDTIIKPYISDKHMLRSSYEFLEKLQEINLNSNQVMVSFDVKSLFTNVSLQETIDLISNKIYDKNSNVNHLPIKKKIFKILLNLATKGIFLYKDKLYQRIDSVSMGSPLGPTIANFFLAETETRLLQQQLNSAPKVYFRYVDDIFAIFNNKADSMEFLDRLNSQHKNLQFTMEKSTNTLPLFRHGT